MSQLKLWEVLPLACPVVRWVLRDVSWGALAYGNNFSRAPTRFWVTAIDAMEASQLIIKHLVMCLCKKPPLLRQGLMRLTCPSKRLVMITGIETHRLQELSAHLAGSQYQFVEFFCCAGWRACGTPNRGPHGNLQQEI